MESTPKAFAAALGAAVIPGLGMPLGCLAAALLGAAISHTPKPGQPDKAIPLRIMGIAGDALIGGWLAMAVLKFRPVAEYGIHDIPPEALCALLALLVQWLRSNVGGYFERLFAAALDAFKRRFGGEAP